MRGAVVLVHRYAGLALAGFLFVSGVTGSVLAFHHELDQWLNPHLFRVDARGAAQEPLALAARVEAADPRVTVRWLPLIIEPGHSLGMSVAPRVDPLTGRAFALDYDQLAVDPVTGEVLGRRLWGACCFEREHLIPFLYKLHYTLHLPGAWGVLLMGVVGLVWLFDSVAGFWLTLPARRGGARGGEPPGAALEPSERSWWRRWRAAWKVKRGAGAFRLNYDLHRAGGLWFWALLIVLAVSSVSFNLHEEVFEPVVNAVSPLTPSPFDQRAPQAPDQPLEPQVALAEVVAAARTEASRRGWTAPAYGVFYSPAYGIYGVGFGTDEHPVGLGNPWLYFDGGDGRFLGAHVPGEGTPGDLFHQLQFPLHSGQIAGLPGRIVICIAGLAVAMLSVTGVYVWWRKRRVRQPHGRRAVSASELRRSRAQTPSA